MIDSTEELIALSKVAKFLPPAFRHLHASTSIRWALRGIGNPAVKLETLKIGGRRFTSRAAVERFIAGVTGGEAVKKVATSKRLREYLEAHKELESDGF